MEKLARSFTQIEMWVIVGLATIILVVYYVWLYQRHKGSTSVSGSVVDRPPMQLSPAAMRYIWIAGYDSDCFIAAVLNAIYKDCYRVQWRKRSFRILFNRRARVHRLSLDERAALSYHARHYVDRLTIREVRDRFVRNAEERLERALHERARRYRLLMHRWVGAGLGFSLIAFVLAMGLGSFVGWHLVVFYEVLLVVSVCIATYFVAVGIREKRWTAWPPMLVLLLSVAVGLWKLEAGLYLHLFPACIPMLVVNGIAFWRLPRLRLEGQRIRNQIEAYRNFLQTRTENGKPLQQDEYELLPYIFALDIPCKAQIYFSPMLVRDAQAQGSVLTSPFGRN